MQETCFCGAELGAAQPTTEGELQVCSACGTEHVTVTGRAARSPATIPGVTRLSDLERRLQAAEDRIALLLRFVDPTSVQLSREDRDQLVAYAKEMRSSGSPAGV